MMSNQNLNQNKNPSLNRREFLGSSARNAATAAAGVVGLAHVNQTQAKMAASSQEKIRVGFVGLRNQGATLLKSFQQVEGCEIAGICDVDQTVRESAIKQIDCKVFQQTQPIVCDDFRRLLDCPALDAIVIATPDHHHAWMAAMACDAGKDVYLEVPTTHTLQQADLLQKMISKTGAIVQVGLQQRSGSHFQSAIDFLHSGKLGEVYQARTWSSTKRQPLNRKPHETSQELSGNEAIQQAWLGEEKSCVLHPANWHYHWRWMWGFGSGELGNWGVHLLDVARWGLNVSLPERVIATGSCDHFHDGRQTPDMMNVLYEYGSKTITWEHKQFSARGIEGRAHGVAFYGQRGVLILDRSGWKVYDHSPAISVPASDLRIVHAHAFVESVREQVQLAANLEVGCISTQLCHLGNLAYRSGKEIRLHPKTGEIISEHCGSAGHQI